MKKAGLLVAIVSLAAAGVFAAAEARKPFGSRRCGEKNAGIAQITEIDAVKAADLPFEDLAQKVRGNPLAARAMRMFKTLYEYKKKAPEKKSEILKAYRLACTGEKMIAFVRKDLEKQFPAALAALEEMVAEVKAEMEARGAGKK